LSRVIKLNKCFPSKNNFMKSNKYEGELKQVPTHEISLNINYLKKGTYVLKIINRNKVIKKTKFKKP